MATYDRKLSIALILSFMFSLSLICHSVASEKEKGMLLDNKNALFAFYQNVKVNETKLKWEKAKFVCDWDGVTCDPTRTYVIQLQLPFKSIVGQIPNNTIGNLTCLEILSLRGNKFTGPIPSDFSNLQELRQFALQNNCFSGRLPDLNVMHIDVPNFDVSFNNRSGCVQKPLDKFRNSSFFGHNNLCGRPSANNSLYRFIVCNTTSKPKNNLSCVTPPLPKKKFPTGAIVGIAVGLPILLLVLRACLRKDRIQ